MSATAVRACRVGDVDYLDAVVVEGGDQGVVVGAYLGGGDRDGIAKLVKRVGPVTPAIPYPEHVQGHRRGEFHPDVDGLTGAVPSVGSSRGDNARAASMAMG